MSNLVLGVLERNVKLQHGLLDRLEGLDNIAEDDWLPLELFVVAEPLSVDELHLLQDG